jgi:hypothetical protein
VSAIDFEPCTYLVVERASPDAMVPAAAAMREDPRLEVVTEKALKFLLVAVRAPEIPALARANAHLDVTGPSERAMIRYLRLRMQPCFSRFASILAPNGPAISRAAARALLYLEHQTEVDTAEALRRAYRRAYGAWPFEEVRDARAFYEREYPRTWDVLDRVLELLDRSPVGRAGDWAWWPRGRRGCPPLAVLGPGCG